VYLIREIDRLVVHQLTKTPEKKRRRQSPAAARSALIAVSFPLRGFCVVSVLSLCGWYYGSLWFLCALSVAHKKPMDIPRKRKVCILGKDRIDSEQAFCIHCIKSALLHCPSKLLAARTAAAAGQHAKSEGQKSGGRVELL